MDHFDGNCVFFFFLSSKISHFMFHMRSYGFGKVTSDYPACSGNRCYLIIIQHKTLVSHCPSASLNIIKDLACQLKHAYRLKV